MGKKTLEELEAERLALEQEAYDDKNRMLKQSQFQELLELQTDEEPEFVEEIVAMFVDDAEAMLVELEELFAEGPETSIDYAKARGVLHKLKGSDKEEQDALRSYHARKAGAYETILKTALEDEDRLKRLTAGAQNVDEEMEPVEEEFDE